jgi:DNA polymerase-4
VAGHQEDITARICCLDLDSFFVSVERLLDPSLIGKPVVVGALPGNRGVVTACSYEVRRFGVHSGMPSAEAYRRAPHAVFLPGRFGVYSPYAKRVKTVVERFCPVVRTASIDEFYLDFHGCERLYHRPGDASGDATIERVIREMRVAIQDEVGLPASAGIGTTKAIAKMASGRAKPAGVLMVPHASELDFVAPLSVRRFPGIGPAAEARLNAAGIETLGQLLALPAGPKRARFQKVIASVLRGVYPEQQSQLAERDRPAFQEHDVHGNIAGSISNERTFSADVGDWRRVEAQLLGLSERACWRARKRDIRARTITLKLRYANFQTVDRGRTVAPTNREEHVYGTVLDLLRKNRHESRAVRLVGIRLSNFIGEDAQLSLPFGPEEQVLGGAVDAVREKFGYDAIRLGTAGGSSRWLA